MKRGIAQRCWQAAAQMKTNRNLWRCRCKVGLEENTTCLHWRDVLDPRRVRSQKPDNILQSSLCSMLCFGSRRQSHSGVNVCYYIIAHSASFGVRDPASLLLPDLRQRARHSLHSRWVKNKCLLTASERPAAAALAPSRGQTVRYITVLSCLRQSRLHSQAKSSTLFPAHI